MITIKNLVKSYESFEVLKNVSIEIASGKITALVGPNGSGKTTLIKSILGLVKPNSGEIIVKGKTVNGDCSYRTEIGYMPQTAHFPENLSLGNVINLIEDIRKSKSQSKENLIDAFDLNSVINKPFKYLSGGTKQKAGLVLSLLFNPSIQIYDEPTAGLDPVSSGRFKDFVLNEKSNGKTILLTSHIMSEIEEVADDIAFLNEGQLQFHGSIISLLEKIGESKLEKAIASLMSEPQLWN